MFGQFFSGLFGASREKKQAFGLYRTLVEQARQPVFYTGFDVADTLDGRFDMILIHMFLLEDRLKGEGEATADLRRMIQEVMIADMDRSLREMGVGDMGIGREVKKMGVAWFGRLKAYALALDDTSPEAALTDAVARNLYKKADIGKPANMAAYIISARAALAGYGLDALKALSFTFPDPAQSLVANGGSDHD